MQEMIRSARDTMDPAMFWIGMILALSTIVGVTVLTYFLNKARPPSKIAPLPRPHLSKQAWADLLQRADDVVATTLAELPPPLRTEAGKLNVVIEKWAPQMLGCYHNFEHGRVSSAGGPIFIFVGSVYQNCELHGLEFEQEIRTTYLHELGHHLGLSESELAQRGL